MSRSPTNDFPSITLFKQLHTRGMTRWEATQINFTVGVRSTICQDTFCSKLSWDYGPGRESCTDKTFCPRHGVLSGFVFNAVHRGILPLASQGTLRRLLKVGTLSYNWSTIGARIWIRKTKRMLRMNLVRFHVCNIGHHFHICEGKSVSVWKTGKLT